MLIGGDDIINDLSHVFQCLFTFVLVWNHFRLTGGNLTAPLTGSHRGITGGIKIPETWLQALLPFQSGLESSLAG